MEKTKRVKTSVRVPKAVWRIRKINTEARTGVSDAVQEYLNRGGESR
jgi:hypothetical protein